VLVYAAQFEFDTSRNVTHIGPPVNSLNWLNAERRETDLHCGYIGRSAS
jgi:hypothetical protein